MLGKMELLLSGSVLGIYELTNVGSNKFFHMTIILVSDAGRRTRLAFTIKSDSELSSKSF